MDLLSPALSPFQINQVLSTCESIIGGLDEFGIKELMTGEEKDLDTIFSTVYNTTKEVLYSRPTTINASNFGYLDKLTSSIDEGLKVLSLNYFIISALPSFDVEEHHIEWGNLIQIFKNLGIIAARDHGKSFEFSYAWPLWKMNRATKGPNPYLSDRENLLHKKGMIITAEVGLATDFMKAIMNEIEQNPYLNRKLYFGNKEWGNTSITCGNGANLIPRGINGALRGRHPGWIDGDDLLDESNLYSKIQRDNVINLFYSVIMNMIQPGGEVKIVGTPFHQQDLYSALKKDRRFRVFEYPGIFPDGRLLYPRRHSYQSLMYKRESQGKVNFTREILVKPVSSDSTIFPWPILETAFLGMGDLCLTTTRDQFPIKMTKVVVAVDLAISANIGADFTVITVWGFNPQNECYYLMYLWREKGKGFKEQIAQVKNVWHNFNPDVVVVENNGFQEAFCQALEDDKVPIVRHTTDATKKDMYNGLPSMALMFEKGQIRFPRGDEDSRNATDIICSEFNSMTFTDKGKLESASGHDDTCSSSYLGIKIGMPYINSGFSFSFI